MYTYPVDRRQGQVGRRFGYLVAVAINGGLLYLINVWPGWEVVPFLTADMRQVLGILNASIVIGMVINFANVIVDRAWFRTAGELVTTMVGLVVLIRFWQVFPFDPPDQELPWPTVFRVALALAIAGTAVAIVIQLGRLLRLGIGARRVPPPRNGLPR